MTFEALRFPSKESRRAILLVRIPEGFNINKKIRNVMSSNNPGGVE
jgi:hypothetical protein